MVVGEVVKLRVVIAKLVNTSISCTFDNIVDVNGSRMDLSDVGIGLIEGSAVVETIVCDVNTGNDVGSEVKRTVVVVNCDDGSGVVSPDVVGVVETNSDVSIAKDALVFSDVVYISNVVIELVVDK
jgi:hypothetical protein